MKIYTLTEYSRNDLLGALDRPSAVNVKLKNGDIIVDRDIDGLQVLHEKTGPPERFPFVNGSGDTLPNLGIMTQIRDIRMVSPIRMIGTLTLLGANFHVEFFRVHINEEGCQEAFNPAEEDLSGDEELLNDFYKILEAAGETMQVPSWPGEWLMFVYPYGQ